MLGVVPSDAVLLNLRISSTLVMLAASPLTAPSAENTEPPVCRIMDFGKFRYEESIKQKQARKSQSRQQIKEVNFHASVDVHDLQTKMRHILTSKLPKTKRKLGKSLIVSDADHDKVARMIPYA